MKHKVIIRKCAEYDADKIAGIIREGMQDLGAIPRGNILLKPNTVTACVGKRFRAHGCFEDRD